MTTESQASDLGDRIEKFLRGPRCVGRGEPPIDTLMQQWVDGVLARDLAASDKLAVAIEYSLSAVAKADANAPLSGPAADARNCYARRAEILEAIARAMRED
jgi:hypothetical protein